MSSWRKNLEAPIPRKFPCVLEHQHHRVCEGCFYLCIVNPLHRLIQLCAVVGDGCSILLKHSQQRTGLVTKHLTLKLINLSDQKGFSEGLHDGIKNELKHSDFFI